MAGISMLRAGLLMVAGTVALSGARVPAQAPAPTPLMVIAEIVAKPETTDSIRGVMKTVAANALKENGCLAYTVYEDQARPGRFLTYETWTGDDALTAHLTSPAMKAGTAQLLSALAQAPRITKLKSL